MTTPAFTWRKLLGTLHLWLGLGSSLIVLTLCLTGTLLALQGPLESWINRDVMRVTPQGAVMPLETLLPDVAARTGKEFTGVIVMPQADQAWPFQEGRAVTYVNPYTGEVLGGVNPAVREVFMTVFRLHRWLLLDQQVGRPVTGAATVIFLVTLTSGVLMWWPKRLAQLGRSLRIRKGASWKLLNYDLHVVLGVLAAVPLLVMGTTGLYWSYRDAFVRTAYLVLDGRPAPAPKPAEKRDADAPPRIDLPFTRVLAETHRAFPDAGPVQITLPTGDQPIAVRKIHMPTPVSMPTSNRLQLDAETGAVLKAEPFSTKSRAEKFLSLVKDIHLGTIFGGLSLTLYVMACLVGTSLPLTGTLHWLGKVRARRQSRNGPALDGRSRDGQAPGSVVAPRNLAEASESPAS